MDLAVTVLTAALSGSLAALISLLIIRRRERSLRTMDPAVLKGLADALLLLQKQLSDARAQLMLITQSNRRLAGELEALRDRLGEADPDHSHRRLH